MRDSKQWSNFFHSSNFGSSSDKIKSFSPSTTVKSLETKIENSDIKKSPNTELKPPLRRELDHSSLSDTSNKRREDSDLVRTSGIFFIQIKTSFP